jgi:hypothetical protein
MECSIVHFTGPEMLSMAYGLSDIDALTPTIETVDRGACTAHTRTDRQGWLEA